MHQSFNLKDVLSASGRPPGQIEDVRPQGAVLDFARHPVCESLARTAAIRFERERRIPGRTTRLERRYPARAVG